MWEFFVNYGLWLLLAIGTGFTFFWIFKNREKLRIRWYGALAAAVLHTVIGLACVKVFAVMETLDFSKAGSMSLFGGVFFLPLLYWGVPRLFKRDTAAAFDIMTPCLVFTLMCARVNCLISGCCLGAYIAGTEGLRYPTRELEIAFYIVLMIYFCTKENRKKYSGLFYPLYLTAYGAFRFITEWFRSADSGSNLHISHLWALIAFLVGITVYNEMLSRFKRADKKRK